MKKYSKLGLFKSKGRLFYERPNKFRTPFQEIEIELYIQLLLED